MANWASRSGSAAVKFYRVKWSRNRKDPNPWAVLRETEDREEISEEKKLLLSLQLKRPLRLLLKR
jgi:hypothetical protein